MKLVMFQLVESLSEEDAEVLFEELRVLKDVLEVGRVFGDPADPDMYSDCFARIENESAGMRLVDRLEKDIRVSLAGPSPARKLIKPITSEDQS